MDQSTYLAYTVRESKDSFIGEVTSLPVTDLPDYPILVRVLFSGLNYKDALSSSGHRGITKNYPHTPGIDAAGVIEESSDSRFSREDQVIVTSYDLGMNTPGGFGSLIRVPGEWIVPLPARLSLRDSMIFGTAGLTAAQGIHAMLHNGQKPEMGPVLVTGARGAVGSLTIMILSRLGFRVIAAVSVLGEVTAFLQSLGAERVIDRTETDDQSCRPLLRPQWAGAFDVVGGNTLATVMKKTSYGGNVVVVGNLGGVELNTTVFPFILNGINLLGIGTQDTPMDLRSNLWNHLATDWKPDQPDRIVTEIGLKELDHYLKIMASKKSRGRVLLNLNRED